MARALIWRKFESYNLHLPILLVRSDTRAAGMIGCCIKLDFNLNLRAKRRCSMAMAKKAAAPVVQTKKPAATPVAAAKPAAAAAVTSTPVRNTPVPKGAVRQAAKKEVTYGDIAQRAYEIWASGQGGSEMDNWLRAERELRGV